LTADTAKAQGATLIGPKGSRLPYQIIIPILTVLLTAPLPCMLPADTSQLTTGLEAAQRELISAQTKLATDRINLESALAEAKRYDSARRRADTYCHAVLPDAESYRVRLAECEKLQSDLDSWRIRVATQGSDASAQFDATQERIRIAAASIADFERQIAAESQTRSELAMRESREAIRAQEDRIENEIALIHVPAPATRTIHEGVILGLTATPRVALELRNQDVSPFTNQRYSSEVEKGRALVVAFGSDGDAAEALRGLMDHLTYGEYTLSSPEAQAIVKQLGGVHFDRLLAHSNGATIAEALIRKNIISVDEFDIAGGDRSLANVDALQQLIDSGLVHRIRVFVNPGDPVPRFTSTPFSIPLREEARYWAGVLTGRREGGDAKVEICVLGGAVGQEASISSHDLRRAYFPNIRGGSCEK
jgi:hypothetical protein